MSRSRKIVLGIVALLVVALVAAYWWQRPLLLTGTGYAAHNACALDRVAGRGDPEGDLPPNPLVPVVRTSADGDETTGSILGALARQHAWYAPGYGCTLADERPDLPEPVEVPGANPYAAAAAPGDVPPGVAEALAAAFGDDLPASDREDLGTRAVVVLKDGELVAERYADGFDATTPQLGWSMTKSVTDLIVGRLVHDGELALDEDGLRPEWTDERAGITVRDLLQMTSGLEWDETYALNTPITRMLYLEPDMGAYVAGQGLAHRPGTYLQYSSGSTTLLCDILAERTGLGPNLPRETVFAPLGLGSAVLEPDPTGTPVCSSYLWASPRDWAAIGQFALQDGVWEGERLLPEGWMEESATAVDVESFEDEPYGRSWWTNAAPDGALVEPGLPADAYFAEGHDGQWIVVVPSEGLVMVRLGFTPEREDNRVLSSAVSLVDALR
ncbi:serine hydrolase [Nocardioides sp. YIM 152588]|uniref:serine hydrolase domain-containing protein n=1 Tax=Nocardioides sp. YIM 152588 TaxID=3158259 RepID=UPI0032E3F186